MELKPDKISIDKITFVKNINPEHFEECERKYIDVWNYDSAVTYYEMFKWNANRHNWKYKGENEKGQEFTIYIGYQSNLEVIKNRFTLEYNPNKVPENNKFLEVILNMLKYHSGFIEVLKFDVAWDYYGITTKELIFSPEGKRSYKIHQYPNGSDPTFYTGEGEGQVRIYDKAHEETKGKADYKKVRYEATIKARFDVRWFNEYKCTTELPEQFINDIQGLYDNQEGLSPTDRLLVYAIQNGFPQKELTYRQRQKYKKIVSERKAIYTKIKPTQSQAEQALKNYISSLFS